MMCSFLKGFIIITIKDSFVGSVLFFVCLLNSERDFFSPIRHVEIGGLFLAELGIPLGIAQQKSRQNFGDLMGAPCRASVMLHIFCISKTRFLSSTMIVGDLRAAQIAPVV